MERRQDEYLKQSPPHRCGQATEHLLHKWPSLAHTGATGVLTFPSSQRTSCSEVYSLLIDYPNASHPVPTSRTSPGHPSPHTYHSEHVLKAIS